MTPIKSKSALQSIPIAEKPEQAKDNDTGLKRHRDRSSSAALEGLPTHKRPKIASEDTMRVRSTSLPPRINGASRVPLSDLIGNEPAAELDTKFGSLQPPRSKNGGIHSWERTVDGRPMEHNRRVILPESKNLALDAQIEQIRGAVDLEALRRGEKKYVWTVGALGRVFIGEELPAGIDPVTGKSRHAGHPLLVGGGPARISGELTYDVASDALIVNNKSGRYSRYEDRNTDHLANALSIISCAFSRSGMQVRSMHVDGKAAEPLVMPTLAKK
jgi:hypothetical protein